ncbi:MAG: hypothetical protein RL701_468 [Pseudomonadota bacterium]
MPRSWLSRLTASYTSIFALAFAFVGAKTHAQDAPNTIDDPTTDSSVGGEMPPSLPEDPNAQHADEDPPLPFRFEVNLVGIFQVRLGEDSGRTSYGYGLTYGVGYGPIPLLLGVNVMSVNTTTDYVSTLSLAVPDDMASVPGNKLARERTLYFEGWLRVQPPHWAVRPYAEGFIGGQLVQSQYTLKLGAGDSAPSSDTINDSAWTHSYGWGAGVDFWGLFNAGNTVSLTLGVRQIFGGDVKFHRVVLVGADQVGAEYKISTNTFSVMLGIMTQFDFAAKRDPYSNDRQGPLGQ